MYNKLGKRLFDLTISILGLLFLSPIFSIITIILFIQNRGNIFYSQLRPGLRQKGFRIFKFKTMTDAMDENGNLLSDNERLTSFGFFLRKFSLDELPQLWNVLKGEMSIVGPRPLLFKYIPLYDPTQLRRHAVRPGLTGWAQVNGRNAISWKRKFELDVYYVNNCSLLLDLKIILLSIVRVIQAEGINQTHARPMEPFTGNN